MTSADKIIPKNKNKGSSASDETSAAITGNNNPVVESRRNSIKREVAEGHKIQSSSPEVPPGKLRAPNARFAETPEAFAEVITRRADDLKAANKIKDDKLFYQEVLKIFKEEMELGDTAPKLNFEETHPNARASYSDTDNTLYVYMNNFPQNDRAKGVAILAHELKHFLQFKEELLTSEPTDALDRLINAKAKNLMRQHPQLSEEQAQGIVQQWYMDNGDYKEHIFDILLNEGWTRNEINDKFGAKVQEYLKNEEHYIDKDESLSIDKILKSYEDQITEQEAYDAGDAAGSAFNKNILGIDEQVRTRETQNVKHIRKIY